MRRSDPPLAITIALVCTAVAGGAAASAAGDAGPARAGGGGHPPKLSDVRCLTHCAGERRTTVSGQVRLRGRRLADVSEVAFPGEVAEIAVAPDSTGRRKVEATVPVGAVSGRPVARTAGGAQERLPKALRIVDPSELPPGFRLRSSRPRPKPAFLGQRSDVRLRYEFEAAERTDVEVELARAGGSPVREWLEAGRLPYDKHTRRWNVETDDGDPAAPGRYRFRLGPDGGALDAAGSLRLYSHRFPVRGSHGYGGHLQSFGAPRSGGRRHQGQDVYASCGTRLEAARGGRVQRRAYDSRLYGHYVVIDGLKTRNDYLYSHLAGRSRPGSGARVHTGERIGAVGKSGNARTTPCHLHFEVWPDGWRHGSPVNPKPALRRWDKWS